MNLLPRLYLPHSKPRSAELNRAHPLARGLVFLPFIDGGANRDLVGGTVGSLSNARWGASAGLGAAVVITTGGGKATWTVPAGNLISWESFTLIVWVAVPTFSGFAPILSTTDGLISLMTDGTAGEWRLYRNNANVRSTAGTFYADNTLHMYAATVDAAGNTVLYTDGVIVGSGKATQNGTQTATGYQLLGSIPSNGSFSQGAAPHALVYNRPLSHVEVQQLQAEPFAMLIRDRRVWAVGAPGATNTAVAGQQALLIGPPKAAAGQQVLLQKAGSATAGASALLVATAPADAPVWPSRAAASSSNFLDHFTSLDASKWTTNTAGGGTVTVTDGYLDLTAPANGTSYAYYNTKLDKTKSQIWWVCASCEQRASSRGSNIIRVLDSVLAPSPDTKTNLDPNTRIEVGMANQTGGLSLLAQYEPAGANQFWIADQSTWGAYVTTRFQPAQLSDYYVVGLEFDGPNLRWRIHLYCQTFTTAGTWQFDQGWREFGLTDWVPWSSMGASDDLWLVLGHINNDSPSTDEYRIEWVRYSEGPLLDAWAGAKQNAAAGHQIRRYYSYDGEVFVPTDRTSWAVPLGASSPDNVEVHNPWVVYDGTSTDWMFYIGYDGTAHYVCVASAPHASPQTGPWTKYASNPVLSQGASGADDDAQINFPFVICDLAESDPKKRWKMLYHGKRAADGKWRSLYATAPDATGPWTKQGTVLDVGPSGANDELWARAVSAVYYNNQWEVWYEGHDASSVDHLMRAVGTDWGTLTKDGTPTYRDNEPGQDQALTTNLNTAPGRTVSVTDASQLTPDAMVLLSQSSNLDTWSATRIRKVIGATQVETYHGLTGFTTSTPARMIQLTGSKTWNTRTIIKVGTEWWFYSVMWEPFSSSGDGANYAAVFEQCFLMKHDAAAPSGASPQYQVLPDPVIPRGFNSDQESVENMSLALQPFSLPQTSTASAGGQTLLQGTFSDAAGAETLLQRTGSDTSAAQALLQKTQTTTAGASGLLVGGFAVVAGQQVLLSSPSVTSVAAGQQALLQGAFPTTAGAQVLLQRTSADSAQAEALLSRRGTGQAGAAALLKGTFPVQSGAQTVFTRVGQSQAVVEALFQRTRSQTAASHALLQSSGTTQAAITALLTSTPGAVAGSVVLLQGQRSQQASLHALFQRSATLTAATQALLGNAQSIQAGGFTILQKQHTASAAVQALFLSPNPTTQAAMEALLTFVNHPARVALTATPIAAVTLGVDLNI